MSDSSEEDESIVQSLQKVMPLTSANVHIIEQPHPAIYRFRYKSDRGSGTIPGASSTLKKITKPSIEINGHDGMANVVVSCVTVTADGRNRYKVHPHRLVGRKYCRNGVCTMKVDATKPVSFAFGIQYVKRDDISIALSERKKVNVDPYNVGFGHVNDINNIDLKAVRLCFQVFLLEGRKRVALPPIVSDVINHRVGDYTIKEMSQCSTPIEGGTRVILLCNKVKDDIRVTFFEEVDGQVKWEVDATDIYVHKHIAVRFTTPAYRDIHHPNNIQAYVQLRGSNPGERGDPLPFELIATCNSDCCLKRKRQKKLDESLQTPERRNNPNEILEHQNQNQSALYAYCPPVLPSMSEFKQCLPQTENYQHSRSVVPQTNALATGWNTSTNQFNFNQNTQPNPTNMLDLLVQRVTGQVIEQMRSNMQCAGLNIQHTPSNVQLIGPNMQHAGSNMQHMGSSMQYAGSNMQHTGSNMQHMGSNMQHTGSSMQHLESNMQYTGLNTPITPIIQNSASNIRQTITSMEQVLPMTEQIASNMQQSVPNMRQTIPSMEQVLPMTEQIASIMQQSVPNMRQTIPSMEQVLPMTEQIASNMQQSVPNMRQTIPSMEQVLPMTEQMASNMQQSVPNMRQTLTMMDQSSPNIQQISSNVPQVSNTTFPVADSNNWNSGTVASDVCFFDHMPAPCYPIYTDRLQEHQTAPNNESNLELLLSHLKQASPSMAQIMSSSDQRIDESVEQILSNNLINMPSANFPTYNQNFNGLPTTPAMELSLQDYSQRFHDENIQSFERKDGGADEVQDLTEALSGLSTE